MKSGFVLVDSIKSQFEYEDKILSIKFNTEEWIDDSNINVIHGKKFPVYNDIIFYKNTNYWIGNGLIKYHPDLVLEYKTKEENIKAITIECDELDYFYDKQLIEEKDYLIETGETTFKTKSFSETDSKKYDIYIDGKEMLLQFCVGRLQNNSLTPIGFNKKIRIEYDFNNNYELIYKTIGQVKRFISFIAYRKNIIFKDIIVHSRNADNLFYKVGNIEYIDKTFIERKTDNNYIRSHAYFYYNILDNIDILFNKISSNEIGLLNIPKDDYMRNIYNEERILMITSTFEDLFNILYGGEVTHKEASIKMREYFLDFLNSNEDKLEFKNSKYTEFWNKLKDYVCFDNFASKFNEVLKKDKYIDNLVKKKYEQTEIKYSRSLIGQRIEKIRNKCAHGEYRKFAEKEDLLVVECLEIIDYVMQLELIRVDIDNINNIVYRVFNIKLSKNELDLLK